MLVLIWDCCDAVHEITGGSLRQNFSSGSLTHWFEPPQQPSQSEHALRHRSSGLGRTLCIAVRQRQIAAVADNIKPACQTMRIDWFFM